MGPLPEEVEQEEQVVVKESFVSACSRLAGSGAGNEEKREKKVGVVTSSSCAQSYRSIDKFVDEVHYFDTGDTYKDVVEKGKTSATENHLSITHVDLSNLGGNREEENVAKACRRADKVCKVMHGHTSVQ